MLTQNSILGELPALITNLVYHAFAHGSEVVGEIRVCENSRNDELEKVIEQRDRLLKEVSTYKIEK